MHTPGEILVTLNPKGFESPEIWAGLKELLESEVLVTFVRDPAALAPSRIEGCRAWLAVGGDGTLNSVVNALMRLPAGKRCALWYVPFGTGNDFARTVGLGEHPPAEILRQAIRPGAVCAAVSVGKCGDRYFLNMASGGLFATVTPEANPTFKNIAGRWAYFVHGIGKLLEREPIQIAVDKEEARPALGFFVANARFAGGGMQVVPEASPFEPDLEFLLVPDMPATDLVALGIELQKENPDLRQFPVRLEKKRSFRLHFDREVPINLDGEGVLEKSPEFSVIPKALQLFLPKKS